MLRCTGHCCKEFVVECPRSGLVAPGLWLELPDEVAGIVVHDLVFTPASGIWACGDAICVKCTPLDADDGRHDRST